MIAATFWEQGGTYLAVLTPLVAVPLTVLTFYLRAVREEQGAARVEVERRFAGIDEALAQVRGAVAEVVRDYATKEEWLRECMHARRRIEELSETVTRLETVVDCRGGAAGRVSSAATG